MELTQKQIKRLNSYIEFLDEYSPLYFDGNLNEGMIQMIKFWLKAGIWDVAHRDRIKEIEKRYQQFLRHKRDGILTPTLVNEIKQYSK